MSAIRSIEVQYTSEWTDAPTNTVPDWTNAKVITVAPDFTTVTIPGVLGSTDYAVRQRTLDVYGQVSDWSVHEKETTTAGADSVVSTAALEAQNVLNGPATVTIDDDGITIEDGALIFKDAYGDEVITGAGFGGGWDDLIASGVFNAFFSSGENVNPLPVGQTGSLPYWTMAKTGSPVVKTVADAESPGGRVVKSTFSDAAQVVTLTSDLFVIQGGIKYQCDICYGAVMDPTVDGEISIDVKWYEPDGTYISLSGGASDLNIGGAVSNKWLSLDRPIGYHLLAPMEARYAAVVVTVAINSGSPTASEIDVAGVRLLPSVRGRSIDYLDELYATGLWLGTQGVQSDYGVYVRGSSSGAAAYRASDGASIYGDNIVIQADGKVKWIDVEAGTYTFDTSLDRTAPDEMTLTGNLKVVGLLTSGTSFPGSPKTGQRIFRTDLEMEFFYDGTRWLSTQLFQVSMPPYALGSSAISSSLSSAFRMTPPALCGGSNVWIENVSAGFNLAAGTGPNSTNKWVYTFVEYTGGTTFATLTIDSGAEEEWRVVSEDIDDDLSADGRALWLCTITKTGTPGALSCHAPIITYRIVAT